MINFKRGANPGKGKEYEINLIALMGLRLFDNVSTQEDFDNFDLGFNLRDMGKFDDLVIILKKNNKPVKSIAVQLKHKEDKKQLTTDMLNAHSGDYSLVQYAHSTENIIDKCDNFVLFSNIKFDLNGKNMEEFTVKQDKECFSFLDTSETSNYHNFMFEPISNSNYPKFERLLLSKDKKKQEKMEKEINVKLFKMYNDFETNRIEIAKQRIFTMKNYRTTFYEKCEIFKELYEKYLRYLDQKEVSEMATKHSETYAKNCELFDKFFAKFSLFPNQKNKHQVKQMIQKIFEKTYSAPNCTEEYINLISAWYDEEKIKDVVHFQPRLDKCRVGKLVVISLLNPFLVNVQPDSHEHYKQWNVFKKVANQFLVTEIQAEIVRNWIEPIEEKNYDLWKESNTEPIIVRIDDINHSRQVLEAIEIMKKIKLKKKIIVIGKLEHDGIDIEDIFTNLFQVQKKTLKDNFKEVFDAFYIPSDLNLASTEDILKLVTPTVLFDLVDKLKQELEELPEHYITRTMKVFRLTSDFTSIEDSLIKEDDLFYKLNRRINILCAEPGMGKTSSMKFLHNQFSSKNYYSMFISFKDHVKFFRDFKDDQNIKSILSYFLNFNQAEVTEETLRMLSYLRRKRVCLFFDGLDELDSKYLDNAINCIQVLLKSSIFKIFISSRKHLKEVLECELIEGTIDLCGINKNDQKKFFKNRLSASYDFSEVETIIETIYTNFHYIQENSKLLGIPLQLYIITEVLLFHTDEPVKDLLILSKLYDHLIKGKLKHLQNKTFKHEDLNKLYNLHKFEIVSLKVCLDEIDFAELITTREYSKRVEEVKKCLTVGIVTDLNENNIAFFEHQTIPEYLSASYFVKNFSQIKNLNKFIFKSKYNTIRYFIDMKLAEKSDLHLAIIYKNYSLVLKSDKHQIQKAKDAANRNLLHLCACYGQTYPELKVKRVVSGWMYDFNIYEEPKTRASSSEQNLLSYLCEYCNFKKEDKLFGWSAVKYAIVLNNLCAINCILKFSSKNSFLAEYCSKNQASILGYSCSNNFTHLLKTISDKSLSNFLFFDGRHVNNPVNLTAKLGQVEALQVLLKKHILDIDLANNIGYTPIHLAAENGHVQCLKLLLFYNSDINCKNFYSRFTALHYSVTNDQIDCVEVLLKDRDLNVNATDEVGFTPLHFAAIQGNVKILNVLLKHEELDINFVNYYGSTALHLAAENGKVECLKELLKYDLDVDCRNQRKFTAANYAREKGHDECLQELIEYKKKKNGINYVQIFVNDEWVL